MLLATDDGENQVRLNLTIVDCKYMADKDISNFVRSLNLTIVDCK